MTLLAHILAYLVHKNINYVHTLDIEVNESTLHVAYRALNVKTAWECVPLHEHSELRASLRSSA